MPQLPAQRLREAVAAQAQVQRNISEAANAIADQRQNPPQEQTSSRPPNQ